MIGAITLRRLTASLVVILAFAALLYAPSPGFATPLLGTAGDFAILAGSAVTNVGSTTINGIGNVGVTPGTSITPGTPGFTFGTGTTHSADAVAGQARIDAFTGVAPISAYNFLAGLPGAIDLSGQDLGTVGTLTPGVYRFSSSAQLTGALTLDNLGMNNAVFVFQIGSMLTTASSSSVLLTGTGTGVGVFWDVGTAATLGSGTAFEGNILALDAITLGTGATIMCGSALARTGGVSGNTNTIGVGCGGGFQSVGDSFELIGPGGGVVVPEPSSFLLLAAGLIGIAGRMRRVRAVRP